MVLFQRISSRVGSFSVLAILMLIMAAGATVCEAGSAGRTPRGIKPDESTSTAAGAIDIKFGEDITVLNAIKILGQMFKKNIVPSRQVGLHDKILVSYLYDVTFEEAIQAVIGENRFVEEGNLIKVYTRQEYADVYGFYPPLALSSLRAIEQSYGPASQILETEDPDTEAILKTISAADSHIEYLLKTTTDTSFHAQVLAFCRANEKFAEQLRKGDAKKAKLYFEALGEIWQNIEDPVETAYEEYKKHPQKRPLKKSEQTSPLDVEVDFSFVDSETTFGEVIDHLRNLKIPGLSIVVSWNDLGDCFVERDSTVGIEGIGRTTLRTGLELILKSVGGSIVELIYTYKDGILVIVSKEYDPLSSSSFCMIPPIYYERDYVQLIVLEEGFLFQGRRYSDLIELNESLSKIEGDKFSVVLEWAFAAGKRTGGQNSMDWLGIVCFVAELEKLVEEHKLGGLCYAGELEVDSKGFTFPKGYSDKFAMNKDIKLDMQSGPLTLKSVRFTKYAKNKGSSGKAIIKARLLSSPKTKFQIRLELLTHGFYPHRAVFSSLYKTIENSGISKGVPTVEEITIEVPFLGDMDGEYLDNVEVFQIRIRQIGETLDETKASEVIGKWDRAFVNSDYKAIKEIAAKDNEKAIEELTRMSGGSGKVGVVTGTKTDPRIIKVTKAGQGRYRVLALHHVRKNYYYISVHYIVVNGETLKIDFDFDGHLKKMRDVRSMSSAEYGTKQLQEKYHRLKNAKGKELVEIADEAVQRQDDRVVASKYAKEHNINIAGANAKEVDDLRVKKKLLEQMTPVQVRDELLKQFENVDFDAPKK